jgi:hypothetical protein
MQNLWDKGAQMPATVLDILKQSDCGLHQSEFEKKARENGILDPYPEFGRLINEGLARIDPNPPPPRFKATKLAFEEAGT